MKTSPLIIYQTEYCKVKIETHFENETTWLNHAPIGGLFQKSKVTISEYIMNIFKDGELEAELVIRNFRTNSSVGYRVKPHRGVHFEKWATALIREYLIKEFAMNDELLKEAGVENYFDKLLSRIRDIRSGEKAFWRNILGVYATSIDYDSNTEQSKLFFQTIQNKILCASHGETAPATVFKPLDSSKTDTGLTNFIVKSPRKREFITAKNYLIKCELDILNRMVTVFLEITEIQALGCSPMYISDWIKQLGFFKND